MDLDVTLPPAPVSGRPVRPLYLLLEQDPVIAADMTGALNEHGECHVVHLTCAGEVNEALRRAPCFDIAFLEITLPEILEAGLEVLLRRAVLSTVLTRGEEHQDQIVARGWHLLCRPFTDQMLREKIAETGIRAGGLPDAG